MSGLPLLVIGTARPEFLERRPNWGGGKLNATTLALAPLSDEETGRLVLALLDRPLLRAEDQAAVVERAGGNPLYAEQYARMLVERGAVAGAPLLESVQRIIAGRLDGLSPEQKRLLQDASVVGKCSGARRSSGSATTTDAKPSMLLHALERKDLVNRARRSSVAGSDEYSFRHVLVRDVAYGQIPRATRSEKHRAAARGSSPRPRGGARRDARSPLPQRARAGARRRDGERRAGRPGPGRACRRGRSGLVAERVRADGGFARQALELSPEDDGERPYLLLRIGRGRRYSDETGSEELMEARDGLLRRGDQASAAEAAVLLADLATQPATAARRKACCRRRNARPGPSAIRAESVGAERARALPDARCGVRAGCQLAGEALELAETLGLERSRHQP